MTEEKKTVVKMAAEVDPYELAVRIAEQVLESKRPAAAANARQAFSGLQLDEQRVFMNAARAVFNYMQERMEELKRVQ